MVVAALVVTAAAPPFGSAHAQEEDDAKPADVDKQGSYVHSIGNAAPDTATEQFPPEVVCLVAPDFCSEDAQQITDNESLSINDSIRDNQPAKTVPPEPFSFAPEGAMPVAVNAGEDRYESAIKVAIPPIPDGQEVATFKLVLTEVPEFTFHSDSPAFRQAVLAAVAFAGRRDPEEFIAEFQKVGSENHPAFAEENLGVEACPILVDWKGEPDQPATEAPNNEGEGRDDEAQIDCALGANGVRQDDGTWVFDLTFAAEDWTEGELPVQGVLLRPRSAQNLAYGDPDPSTWDQVTFEGANAEDEAALPKIVLELEEKTELLTFGGAPSLGSATPSGGEAAAAAPSSGSETFTETFGGMEEASRPEPVEAGAAPQGGAGDQVGQAAPAGLTSNPVTAWWVWLAFPLLLAGSYLTSQALTAQPQVAIERAGAMSKIVARSAMQ